MKVLRFNQNITKTYFSDNRLKCDLWISKATPSATSSTSSSTMDWETWSSNAGFLTQAAINEDSFFDAELVIFVATFLNAKQQLFNFYKILDLFFFS